MCDRTSVISDSVTKKEEKIPKSQILYLIMRMKDWWAYMQTKEKSKRHKNWHTQTPMKKGTHTFFGVQRESTGNTSSPPYQKVRYFFTNLAMYCFLKMDKFDANWVKKNIFGRNRQNSPTSISSNLDTFKVILHISTYSPIFRITKKQSRAGIMRGDVARAARKVAKRTSANKALSEAQRSAITDRWASEMLVRAIAEQQCVGRQQIRLILARFQKNEPLGRRQGSGPKRKTTPGQDAKLILDIKRDS